MARFLETWLSGTDPVQYTPRGLAWASEWGTLRYTMNAALIAQIVAKQIASMYLPLSSPYSSILTCVCMLSMCVSGFCVCMEGGGAGTGGGCLTCCMSKCAGHAGLQPLLHIWVLQWRFLINYVLLTELFMPTNWICSALSRLARGVCLLATILSPQYP